MKKINNPLKIDTIENSGENWLIVDFGCDENGDKYIVTTDHVHASEFEAHTPKEYAEVFVKTPKMQELLEEVLNKVKPKLVFGEENEILDLLERIDEVVNDE